jgi:hypothetical protein
MASYTVKPTHNPTLVLSQDVTCPDCGMVVDKHHMLYTRQEFSKTLLPYRCISCDRSSLNPVMMFSDD